MAKKLIFVWLSITIIACSSISIYATTQEEEYTDKKIETSQLTTEVASRTTKNIKAITSEAQKQAKAEIEKKKAEAEAGNLIKGIVNYIQHINGNVGDEQAREMANLFVNAGKKYSVDPLYLVAIAKHESNFYTDVISSAGCKGLMQTSDTLAVKYGYSGTDAYTAKNAIDIGAHYLSECLKDFNGDYMLALSGYAYGCGAVKSGNFNYGYANDFTEIKNTIKTYVK